MIVIATENDLAALLELEHAEISPPWSEAQMLREIYGDDTYFVVARPETEILGFAVLRHMADEAELFRIVTRRDAQRRGIADAMLTDVLKNASTNGAQSVFLEVRESNGAARRLYEKHGFESLGVRRNYYDAPPENAVIMQKSFAV